jgi:hypothetical protein
MRLSCLYPMVLAHRPHIAHSTWFPGGRVLAMAIALLLLFGAMVTPWGLVQSHGLADVSALHHGEGWEGEDEHGHGHSHEDEVSAHPSSHPHHDGDHSHDHAHALPIGLPGLSGMVTALQAGVIHSGPWPSLDGLERPPRA